MYAYVDPHFLKNEYSFFKSAKYLKTIYIAPFLVNIYCDSDYPGWFYSFKGYGYIMILKGQTIGANRNYRDMKSMQKNINKFILNYKIN